MSPTSSNATFLVHFSLDLQIFVLMPQCNTFGVWGKCEVSPWSVWTNSRWFFVVLYWSWNHKFPLYHLQEKIFPCNCSWTWSCAQIGATQLLQECKILSVKRAADSILATLAVTDERVSVATERVSVATKFVAPAARKLPTLLSWPHWRRWGLKASANLTLIA